MSSSQQLTPYCSQHTIWRRPFWLLRPTNAPSTFLFAVTRVSLKEDFQQQYPLLSNILNIGLPCLLRPGYSHKTLSSRSQSLQLSFWSKIGVQSLLWQKLRIIHVNPWFGFGYSDCPKSCKKVMTDQAILAFFPFPCCSFLDWIKKNLYLLSTISTEWQLLASYF